MKVIDPSARFPEGPVWHDGKLYYVEYGGHTVKTWDGLKLAEFWKSDGCGPSAVAPFGDGFLVAGYDAGAMVRISVDGRTIQTIDKDISGGGFLGPNDIAPDGKGGSISRLRARGSVGPSSVRSTTWRPMGVRTWSPTIFIIPTASSSRRMARPSM
jgi:hypothetical protein